MFERIQNFLVGSDNWVVDGLYELDDKNEFLKSIRNGQKEKIEERLNSSFMSIRDRDIIGGLKIAITHGRVEILKLLVSHQGVKEHVTAHPNLETYLKETGNWGIIGKISSTVFSRIENSSGPEPYDNLLTYALDLYKDFLYKSKIIENLQVIDILLKSGLFDINKPRISRQTDSKSHTRELTRPYKDESEEWNDYYITTTTKSAIYIACETGNVELVKRILQEKNINIHCKCIQDKYFETTDNTQYPNKKSLGSDSKDIFTMLEEKGFNVIAELLKKYDTSISASSTNVEGGTSNNAPGRGQQPQPFASSKSASLEGLPFLDQANRIVVQGVNDKLLNRGIEASLQDFHAPVFSPSSTATTSSTTTTTGSDISNTNTTVTTDTQSFVPSPQ